MVPQSYLTNEASRSRETPGKCSLLAVPSNAGVPSASNLPAIPMRLPALTGRACSALAALGLFPTVILSQAPTVDAAPLRPDQYESAVLLGRVWGFVKYHHARFVVAGANADSALIESFSLVLEAKTPTAARDSIVAWLDRIGPPPPCADRCASGTGDVALSADIAWIRDSAAVGARIAERLGRIHAERPQVARQHYAGPATQAQNPGFTNEPPYEARFLAHSMIRLVGVFRLWNILEYWFPYRDLMEPDRVSILRDAVLAAWTATRTDDYQRVLIRLMARAQDTHANLWSSLSSRPPVGRYVLPVGMRMIEGKPVVFRFTNDSLGPRSGLQVGDAILAVDGAPVDSLFRVWAPLYAASNQPTRERDMTRGLGRGDDTIATLLVDRGGKSLLLRVPRVSPALTNPMAASTHDVPGETFRMLTPEVAYVKLGPLMPDSVAGYVQRAMSAKVFVVDNRNYPSHFPLAALGGHLVPARAEFARITAADWSNPGTFRWSGMVSSLQPRVPLFTGKVVVLVDEATQSSAEFHAMAFRTAPGALVVGSTTAGADGNVSRIPLPGGMHALISGIGVFYPDRKPTQQIGIVPDLVVRPTLAGFRAGRDEVLEAGVSRALGRPFKLQP